MEIRQRIWDNMLIVGHLTRCYAAVAKRMQWLHLILSSLTIMASIGAATLLLAERTSATEVAGALLFFSVAAVSVAMLVFDFSRQAQVARTVDAQLREIEVDLRRLWHLEEPPTEKIENVESRIDSVTREDVILISDKLSKKSHKDALDVLNSYYEEPRKATTTGDSPTTNTA